MVCTRILWNIFLGMERKIYTCVFVVSTLILLGSLKVQSQSFWREKGVLTGFGHGIDSLNIPEGRYVPVFFMAHFGWDPLKNKEWKKTIPGIFTIYFQPQFNPVFVRKAGKTVKDIEFGLNIGFKHMYPITSGWYAYMFIAAGPHFISVHTIKQTRGFIFSDNFGVGTSVFIKRDLALNFEFRLRHLSNGDTRQPNQGINTFNYHIGVSKLIR
jgi:hypothetical protein